MFVPLTEAETLNIRLYIEQLHPVYCNAFLIRVSFPPNLSACECSISREALWYVVVAGA